MWNVRRYVFKLMVIVKMSVQVWFRLEQLVTDVTCYLWFFMSLYMSPKTTILNIGFLTCIAGVHSQLSGINLKQSLTVWFLLLNNGKRLKPRIISK